MSFDVNRDIRKAVQDANVTDVIEEEIVSKKYCENCMWWDEHKDKWGFCDDREEYTPEYGRCPYWMQRPIMEKKG